MLFLHKRIKQILRAGEATWGFCLLCFLSTKCPAAFEPHSSSARALAMASACCAVSAEPTQAIINPAAIGGAKGIRLSVSTVKPYGLADLQTQTAALVFSRSLWSCAGVWQQFGASLYREEMVALTMARSMGGKTAVGITLRHAGLQISRYGRSQALMVDCGLWTRPYPAMACGFSVSNLNEAKIGRCREPLPKIFRWGVALSPLPAVQITIDVSKDIHYPIDFSLGVELLLQSILCLRAGTGSEPGRFAAGMSCRISAVRFDYAVEFNAELGAAHQIGVVVWPGKSSEP